MVVRSFFEAEIVPEHCLPLFDRAERNVQMSGKIFCFNPLRQKDYDLSIIGIKVFFASKEFTHTIAHGRRIIRFAGKHFPERFLKLGWVELTPFALVRAPCALQPRKLTALCLRALILVSQQ